MAHKGHAASKKRSLQTKKMCCKQKTIAANKKDALQTVMNFESNTVIEIDLIEICAYLQ